MGARRSVLGPVTGWRTAFTSATAAVVVGCGAPEPLVLGPLDVDAETTGATWVHLFEWRWTDVADECEQFLGPAGYAAVQVSPPNEHIALDTWWARYQPVSYQLESRGGTRAEFVDMVERCQAVGVDILVDAVINHTAAWQGGGVGWAGTAWSYKDHPDAGYDESSYHPSCGIDDYRDATTVQNCELVGLPDLHTGRPEVQDRIAAYLSDLLAIGVAGFRIDAAKHMAAADIDAILARAGDPDVFLEVIGAEGEAVQPAEYTGMGKVTEFGYTRRIGDAVLRGRLRDLRLVADDLLPAASAVVFTDNHDNQRGHGAGGEPTTHARPTAYALANVFMLGWPYGTPKVMSSYAFTDTDAGPPAASGCSASVGPDAVPADGYLCEHRWPAIASMVEFRSVTRGLGVSSWWDNRDRRVAFSRGDRGFVAINDQAGTMDEILATTLPAGSYCDVIGDHYLPAENRCTGVEVEVLADGSAQIVLEPHTALAIHAEARVGMAAAR